MMNKVFIDTNVILDVLAEREKFYKDSYSLIYELSDIDKYISTLTVASVAYHIEKRGNYNSRTKLKEFFGLFNLVNLSNNIIYDAFKAATPDLEDGIQIVSCLEVSDIFITRDKTDFKPYENVLEIVTPREYLRKQNS